MLCGWVQLRARARGRRMLAARGAARPAPSMAWYLKGKMEKELLLSLRMPKCELCELARNSSRPAWSGVPRSSLLKAMSVWPAKYLTMKPPHTNDASPMAPHSGRIAGLYHTDLSVCPFGSSLKPAAACSQPLGGGDETA